MIEAIRQGLKADGFEVSVSAVYAPLDIGLSP